jgi:hypothetical protein
MRERDIQDEIRRSIPPTIAVLWRNNVGMSESVDAKGAVRRTKFGLCNGSSDLIGLRRSDGRFIALEVKRPGLNATEEQRMFMELVRSLGGIAAVVTSSAEALRAIIEG